MLDAVVVGAGLSGLSLACRLLTPGTGIRTLALVDPAPLAGRDRAWAFWSAAPLVPPGVATRQWPLVRVHAAGRRRVLALGDYRYHRLTGADLETAAAAVFARSGAVTVVEARARALREVAGGVEVDTDAGTLTGRWAFDSRPRPRPSRALLGFTGWDVVTSRPVFDPAVATLFDFRTPQGGGARFVYVLPWSPHAALVEHTSFTACDAAPGPPPEEALAEYLTEVLHSGGYQVTGGEEGVIPLAPPLPRRVGGRTLTIGTGGGLVRPSTGYGCERILRDGEAVARSLRRHGHPFDVPGLPWRHRLADALLLRVLRDAPEVLEEVFAALFTPQRVERSLRFLDGDSRPVAEAALVAALPPKPFLVAAAAEAAAALRRPRPRTAAPTGAGTRSGTPPASRCAARR